MINNHKCFFSLRWQRAASYLSANLVDPSDLDTCISHRELWRGGLVIREKKVITAENLRASVWKKAFRKQYFLHDLFKFVSSVQTVRGVWGNLNLSALVHWGAEEHPSRAGLSWELQGRGCWWYRTLWEQTEQLIIGERKENLEKVGGICVHKTFLPQHTGWKLDFALWERKVPLQLFLYLHASDKLLKMSVQSLI